MNHSFIVFCSHYKFGLGLPTLTCKARTWFVWRDQKRRDSPDGQSSSCCCWWWLCYTCSCTDHHQRVIMQSSHLIQTDIFLMLNQVPRWFVKMPYKDQHQFPVFEQKYCLFSNWTKPSKAVQHYRYLGICLDSRLSVKTHIEPLCSCTETDLLPPFGTEKPSYNLLIYYFLLPLSPSWLCVLWLHWHPGSVSIREFLFVSSLLSKFVRYLTSLVELNGCDVIDAVCSVKKMLISLSSSSTNYGNNNIRISNLLCLIDMNTWTFKLC